jgi:C-8 sterol isomerase
MGYVFDPQHLHEIARKRMHLPHQEMVQAIIDDLASAYPRHVETRQNWLFSLSGGGVGIMTILHASLSEYVILFGTPVGTEGCSGRYRLEIHDFVLKGEMWTYTEEAFLERTVTRPGECGLLKRRQVKGFRLLEGTWMLEYGRGFIPSALPLSLGDAVFSCMDWWTVGKTFWLYGKQVVKQLLRGKI